MANRYWVGGTGTWNTTNTTNWSATSGGAGGASVPVISDSVFIDSLSGAGIITTATGAICGPLSHNSSTLNVSLGADLFVNNVYTFTQGTITLNSYKLLCAAFYSSNSNTRTIAFGTGNIDAGAGGTSIGTTILSMATLTNNSSTD